MGVRWPLSLGGWPGLMHHVVDYGRVFDIGTGIRKDVPMRQAQGLSMNRR